jgi:CIC family chloride channel protein
MGASSGLAAAFNSPLAAITFAIEEITGDLNSRFLGDVVLSSLGGAFVVYAFIGRQPAFALPSIDNVSWVHYAVVPLVALLAVLAGVVFQRATLFWRGKLKARLRLPGWLQPALGGYVTWVLGTGVFLATDKLGVFGLGYRDLSDALRNGSAWKIAGIVLAVVGMSACLGAVVRALLISLLIVFEMTHQFSLVPGLMLGAIISQATARLAGRLNFYDALLVQDGHEFHKIRPPVDLQSWQNLPVGAIANPRPLVLRELSSRELKETAGRCPYISFPLVIDGELRGVVSLAQALSSIQRGGPRDVQRIATCYPDQTVREIGDKFIESGGTVLVVIGREDGSIRGIITLHDLVRAQAAAQT